MKNNEYNKVKALTLPQKLMEGCNQWSDYIYMRHKYLGIWQTYTWKDVCQKVRFLSLGLKSIGLKPGESVAIIGENCLELYWSEFAALANRAQVVCLYPDMTPQEVHYILDHCGAVYLFAEDQEQVDKYLQIKKDLLKLRKAIYWEDRGLWDYKDHTLMHISELEELGTAYEAKNANCFERMVAEGKEEDIAIISYTSGTTGLPKGVILSHKYLFDNAWRMISSNEMHPFTQYLSYIAPAWGIEQYMLAASLLVPLIYNFPEKPETVQKNFRELGAECLIFGPRQWESMSSLVQARMGDAGPVRRAIYKSALYVGMKVATEITEGKKAGEIWHILNPIARLFVLQPILNNLGLSKTYMAMNGGAAAAPDVFRFFHALGLKLRNGYGSTEIGLLTQHVGNTFDLESIGKWNAIQPHYGEPIEYKITSEGELLIKGGHGFDGYYKDENALAEKMENGWFKTGDAVTVKKNGEVVYLDRVKDLRRLKTGHLFPPQYIENRLRFSPFIKEAMILGDEHTDTVSALVNIDSESVGRWAEKNSITYSTFTDLTQKDGVYQLIAAEFEEVNKALETASRVKSFVNLPKELDPDESELTRTRKLRRGFLEERYGKLIEAIYRKETSYVSEVPVKYRDGRVNILKTQIRIMQLAD